MPRKRELLLVGIDVAIIIGSIVSSAFLRLGIEPGVQYLEAHTISFLVSGLTYIVLLFIGNQYDVRKDYRSLPEFLTLLYVSIGAFMLSTSLFYVDWSLRVGRGVYLLNAILVTLGIALWRRLYSRLVVRPSFQRRALLLGLGKEEGQLLHEVIEIKTSGIRLIGALVDDWPSHHNDERNGITILGGMDRLEKVLVEQAPDLLITSNGCLSRHDVCQELFIQQRHGTEVIHLSDLYEKTTGKVPIHYVSDYLLHMGIIRSPIYAKRVKGLIDKSAALLALVLLSPIAFLIMVGTMLTSPGGIVYVQERLGAGGRKFKLLKFRTMTENAEQNTGPVWASENDQRITRFGRFLRRSRLDEIPQLINVLLGDMSLVGPRPEREPFIRQFQGRVPVYREGKRKNDPANARVQTGWQETIPLYSLRFAVKPGITGWAQINGNYAASVEESWEKFAYDLYYIKNQSLLLDVTILTKTLWVVLGGNGR
ncbi:MAG: sugar transferase [candidate division NC10 bacterium]|nr:sugar transferase [candidate division NC10 bacterium]